MLTCPTKKNVYQTRDQAVHALLDARVRYDFTNGNGPVAVYQCDECGYFHLTSKGPTDEVLTKQVSSGEIARRKEAARWLDKFKKH